MAGTVVVTSFDDVKDAFRQKTLKQALYDEGADLMASVIVNLHGDEHRIRRRVENRLFRRETFRLYEQQLVPGAIEEELRPHLERGSADLQELARRTMLRVALLVAGIDVPNEAADRERLADLMPRLSRASTVVHSSLPKEEVVADGQQALSEFERDFLQASAARRRALVAAFHDGQLGEDELPKDVLTTLLRYQEELQLSWDLIRKEVAYFPWVGSHSTANAFTHTMDEIFRWLNRHPEDRPRVRDDVVFLQRCVHETVRLHPASPEAQRHALETVKLGSGLTLPAGSFVVLDLTTANRDPSVFGVDADEFNPYRTIRPGVPAWGHSFGGGVHACIGQELAGGLAYSEGADPSEHLFGTIVVMARTLLRHGAEPDPEQRAEQDPTSRRPHFGSFPVRFTTKLSSAP